MLLFPIKIPRISIKSSLLCRKCPLCSPRMPCYPPRQVSNPSDRWPAASARTSARESPRPEFRNTAPSFNRVSWPVSGDRHPVYHKELEVDVLRRNLLQSKGWPLHEDHHGKTNSLIVCDQDGEEEEVFSRGDIYGSLHHTASYASKIVASKTDFTTHRSRYFTSAMSKDLNHMEIIIQGDSNNREYSVRRKSSFHALLCRHWHILTTITQYCQSIRSQPLTTHPSNTVAKPEQHLGYGDKGAQSHPGMKQCIHPVSGWVIGHLD